MTTENLRSGVPVFDRATGADVPTLVALMESAYRGDASKKGWTTEADLIDGARTTVAEIEGVLADPDQIILVVRDPADFSRLLGCGSITRLGEHLGKGETNAAEPACMFGKFAVNPALQGSGLGKLILAELEQLAKSVFGAVTMVMTVIDSRTELLNFYYRRGYVPTGGSVKMVDLHPTPDMTRGHDLVLIELAKSLV